jgi:hypothetical protein
MTPFSMSEHYYYILRIELTLRECSQTNLNMLNIGSIINVAIICPETRNAVTQMGFNLDTDQR